MCPSAARSTSPSDPARAALRSAARAIALQIGLAAAVLVLLATAGVGVLFDRAQSHDITATLQDVATTADDAGDPPSGVWLVVDRGDAVTSTPSTPAAVREAAAVLAARRTGPSGPSRVSARGVSWPAWVSVRDNGRVVAVYDIARHHAEERRLQRAAGLTGVIGVALAALIGLLAGRRAVRPLGDALRLQDQFIADASHELRTPLAVVSTRAQLIGRRLPAHASPALRRGVDQLVADTQAMGDVVSELLQAAQLGHAPERAVRLDVGALVTDVVTSMAPYAAEHGITLVTAPVPDGTVQAARSGLRRAVVALVDNAIAHSPAGTQVTVGASVASGEVVVAVVDHGQGVDPAEASALAGRFRRGDQRPDAGRGREGERVGLGLALVTQVVRSHGGRLEVGQTPGGGATFAIVLPVAPPTLPA